MDWLITVILSKMVLRNLKKKIINPIIYLQNIDHSFLEQEFVFSEDLLTIYTMISVAVIGNTLGVEYSIGNTYC